MFLGRHDEVVRIVFVIHNVFEVDARHVVQLFEKLLVENERHATDLRHLLEFRHVGVKRNVITQALPGHNHPPDHQKY